MIALALVVGVVLYARQDRPGSASEAASGSAATAQSEGPGPSEDAAQGSGASVSADATQSSGQTKSLPRLVDLGASKCIPCKMMAPILDELKNEYEGRMEVIFIDVWKNPRAGEPYEIRTIPTQIFYDASGKERFRHEGFISKEDILAKCEELGFDLQS